MTVPFSPLPDINFDFCGSPLCASPSRMEQDAQTNPFGSNDQGWLSDDNGLISDCDVTNFNIDTVVSHAHPTDFEQEYRMTSLTHPMVLSESNAPVVKKKKGQKADKPKIDRALLAECGNNYNTYKKALQKRAEDEVVLLKNCVAELKKDLQHKSSIIISLQEKISFLSTSTPTTTTMPALTTKQNISKIAELEAQLDSMRQKLAHQAVQLASRNPDPTDGRTSGKKRKDAPNAADETTRELGNVRLMVEKKQNEVCMLQNEIAKLKEDRDLFAADLDRVEGENKQLKETLQAMTAKHDGMKQELESCRNKLAKLEKQMESNAEAAKQALDLMTAERDASQKKLRAAIAECAEAKQDLFGATDSLQKMNARCTALAEEAESGKLDLEHMAAKYEMVNQEMTFWKQKAKCTEDEVACTMAKCAILNQEVQLCQQKLKFAEQEAARMAARTNDDELQAKLTVCEQQRAVYLQTLKKLESQLNAQYDIPIGMRFLNDGKGKLDLVFGVEKFSPFVYLPNVTEKSMLKNNAIEALRNDDSFDCLVETTTSFDTKHLYCLVDLSDVHSANSTNSVDTLHVLPFSMFYTIDKHRAKDILYHTLHQLDVSVQQVVRQHMIPFFTKE